jgi:hypothetical protein
MVQSYPPVYIQILRLSLSCSLYREQQEKVLKSKPQSQVFLAYSYHFASVDWYEAVPLSVWYTSPMAKPQSIQYEKELLEAEAAVENARRVRRHHARKTDKGTPARERDIESALARLKAAMIPLRSLLGQFTYLPFVDEDFEQRVRDLSQDIQGERRRLWKMQKR